MLSASEQTLLWEKLVTEALDNLHVFGWLGKHPLAELRCVKQYLPSGKTVVTHLDYGRAVQAVLFAGLYELRQFEFDPDSNEARYYPVLEKRYVKRTRTECAAREMFISEPTFQRARREGIRCLAEIIVRMEERAREADA